MEVAPLWSGGMLVALESILCDGRRILATYILIIEPLELLARSVAHCQDTHPCEESREFLARGVIEPVATALLSGGRCLTIWVISAAPHPPADRWRLATSTSAHPGTNFPFTRLPLTGVGPRTCPRWTPGRGSSTVTKGRWVDRMGGGRNRSGLCTPMGHGVPHGNHGWSLRATG